MLNKFPLWKYLLVLAVVAIGLLYASPNLYGRDPAIQVSGAKGADVDLSVVDKVNSILKQHNVTAKSTVLEDGQILVRLKNVEEQLKAHDLLRDSLSDDYISAINMAPAQPAWLKAVGGEPMKLGLDLSGGVHFTMEIDMATAVDNQLEQMEQDFRSDLREEKLRYRSVRRVAGSERMRVEMRTEEDKNAAESVLETRYPLNVYIDDSSNDKAFFATMSEQKLKEIRDYAIKQNETKYSPAFGEANISDLFIAFKNLPNSYSMLGNVYKLPKGKDSETFLAGKRSNWKIDEVEVWSVTLAK